MKAFRFELIALGVIVIAAWYLWEKIKSGYVPGALNPASDKNIVYGSANEVLQNATGTPDTIGTYLYGIFNPSKAAGGGITAPITVPISPAQPEYNPQDVTPGNMPLGA